MQKTIADISSQLILLPGFDGTGDLFAPLQKAFKPEVATTVIRYINERSFEDYVDTIVSVLPKENAIIVAESFSGPIALALLERYPSKVKCAVLSATFAVSPFRSLAGIAKYLPTLLFKANPMQSAIVKSYCLSKEPDTELLNQVMRATHSLSPITIKERLAVLAGIDMRPILSKITTPVLYLKALQDKIVSDELTDQLVNGLAKAEVYEIDSPHMLLQTCPDECAREITRFMLNCA